MAKRTKAKVKQELHKQKSPSTQVLYLKSLPKLDQLQHPKKPQDFLFIVDEKILQLNSKVAHWLKEAPNVYRVEAGEQLKNLKDLPRHLYKIFFILGDQAHRGLTVVAIGGGSVGDFAGFVASVFKRGLDFIQIPGSWLAAIDSSHGGKNGLNLEGLKNQIGTFHHPVKVYIVESVLASQSEAQFDDSLGELYKMGLLTKKKWGQELISTKNMNHRLLWKFLPFAIEEKYRIVKLDPEERKGIRHFLNLGHTFGHVVELQQKLPHGRSVAIGLLFALRFSFDKKILKEKTWVALQKTPMYQYLNSLTFEPLSEEIFLKILNQDKKKTARDSLQFVFLKDLGSPVLLDSPISELVAAGRKYGFIY